MYCHLVILLTGLVTAPLAMPDSVERVGDSPVIGAIESGGVHETAAPVAQRRYAVSVTDRNWFDAQRGRSVPVKIYFPSADTEPSPVIVFSTGLGRSRDDCAYLGRHWASCGYVSIHVQHPGSDDEAREASIRPRKKLQRAFYAPQNIRNRPLDIIFVLDQVERQHRQRTAIGSQCDLGHIGVAGHDFGARPCWRWPARCCPAG